MDLMATMDAYKSEASWAIWEVDGSGQLTGAADFPPDGRDAIHGRSMIVSLNPASNRSTTPPLPRAAWSNFHSPLKRHNDMFLASALLGTRLWGAYMTDLHPSVSESDSRLVNPNSHEKRGAVDALVEQARSLGTVELVVCVGRKSFDTIAAHWGRVHQALGPTSIVAIPHYSGAAARSHRGDPARYRSLVHEALGLDN